MFPDDRPATTSGRMEARKEVRMHRDDEALIRAAAAATGLQEADFIRQAAVLRAREVERRLMLSILPVAAFEDFKAAVAAEGRVVPGLAAAARAADGALRDG